MKEDLGQLIITGINGTSLSSKEKKFIKDNNIGGVILFTKNFQSPEQLVELTNSIQELRRNYPLYIAVDHEGGRIIRFKKYFTQPPSMYRVSKTSTDVCFNLCNIMATELNACGININFSPVCDIWNNEQNEIIGDRAFGKDYETVSKFIVESIRGFQKGGVMACAKHFPGHGCTLEDSHYQLPIVEKSLKGLEKEEFIPFIHASNSNVDFIMVAHLKVKAFGELITTVNNKVYRYLREKIKFRGIIITDDMQMNAISDIFNFVDSSVNSILAGADIIEFRDMENAEIALEGIRKAYNSNILAKDIISDRINRIYKNKENKLIPYTSIELNSINKINTKKIRKFLSENF